MSSYLTFYGVPKVKDEEKEDKSEQVNIEPVKIVMFSRNNDIYSYFNDNCDIAFSYDEQKYSDVTMSDVEGVKCNIMEDIRSSEKRLNEYEKYASSNPDYIPEILSVKEYLEDLYRALHYAEFIGYIVSGAEYRYGSSFSKIVADIG